MLSMKGNTWCLCRPWQVLRKASLIRAGRVSAIVSVADERESARSEGRLAGASERLFESLPGPAIAISVT